MRMQARDPHLVFAALVALLMLAATPHCLSAHSFQGKDITGMYSFVQQGEFVQITVEDEAGHEPRVSGFISRYGDAESDRGVFLDHFFSRAALKHDDLAFTSKPVHGTWFEFQGKVSADPNKDPTQWGYVRISGRLTEHSSGAEKKMQAKSRDIVLLSFPRDDEAVP